MSPAATASAQGDDEVERTLEAVHDALSARNGDAVNSVARAEQLERAATRGDFGVDPSGAIFVEEHDVRLELRPNEQLVGAGVDGPDALHGWDSIALRDAPDGPEALAMLDEGETSVGWQLDAPDGAVVEVADDGSLSVTAPVNGELESLTVDFTIEAPWALDAAGVPVDTW